MPESNGLKVELTSPQTLVHFSESRPLGLATDASQYGIGAVLYHVMPDGSERPIAFASRTLNIHERNYAQIEKEGLAIIFGVTHFHQYLMGREFLLQTDNKPLTKIFGPKADSSSTAVSRLQRWALILQAYRYTIVFRPKSRECRQHITVAAGANWIVILS